MTRRLHALLIAGCFVVAVLQAPIALRSVGEVWSGPYAAPEGVVEVAVPTEALDSDAARVAEAAEPAADESQLAQAATATRTDAAATSNASLELAAGI